ncbi:hypothetical protein IFM89_022768 [Coptis chinensis]|uniref:Nuclease associated modular domain-containing protein n=1 Tax=Coptis chinensis TaxID=261450 RepID=A0A835IP53_9MAGN|nr:hypothetical protein IFM89_022768 [Coptis chinensis]
MFGCKPPPHTRLNPFLKWPHCLHLRLLLPASPHNYVPNTLSRPLFIYVMDGYHLQQTVVQANAPVSVLNIRSHSPTFANFFSRVHSARTLQLSDIVGNSSQRTLKAQVSASLSWNHTIDEERQVDFTSGCIEDMDVKADKEIERRKKIGVANKGKAPWNKGRKHSAETRELIKQRTIEALKDPKVRKKMSEGHRPHSDVIKAKIGLGQRRVWRKRLKLKSIKEKFYHMWSESIAEAAKKGLFDQQELDWDSYEKLAAEIAHQQLQLAADEERVKEITKLLAARERAERMARRALQKKEKEERAKSEGEVKRRRQRKPKKQMLISKGLKLKARITKIRQKKSIDGQVGIPGDVPTSHQPAIEKLDLEFIKREKLRKELSLADQIRAAKKKRAESAKKEELAKISSNLIMDSRVEELVCNVQ